MVDAQEMVYIALWSSYTCSRAWDGVSGRVCGVSRGVAVQTEWHSVAVTHRGDMGAARGSGSQGGGGGWGGARVGSGVSESRAPR